MIVETCRRPRGQLSPIPGTSACTGPQTWHPTHRKLTLFWNGYKMSASTIAPAKPLGSSCGTLWADGQGVVVVLAGKMRAVERAVPRWREGIVLTVSA